MEESNFTDLVGFLGKLFHQVIRGVTLLEFQIEKLFVGHHGFIIDLQRGPLTPHILRHPPHSPPRAGDEQGVRKKAKSELDNKRYIYRM